MRDRRCCLLVGCRRSVCSIRAARVLPKTIRPSALHEAAFAVPMVDVVNQLRPINRNIFGFEQADDLAQVAAAVRPDYS
jgi:hypothetical protein